MPMTPFAQLADEWISATLTHSPGLATQLGIHDYDGELGDRSRESTEGRARTLRALLGRLEAIAPATLAPAERPDCELLRRRILWELVTIEELETWRSSPGGYLGSIGGGCNGLIIRDFAPLEERARSLVSRLRQAPRVLEQAKVNLDACPRIHVETAIEQAAGVSALLQRDLPDALSGLGDRALRAGFQEAPRAAADALDGFAAWLKDDLLPRSNADFAYGPDRFSKLLAYADFVERPPDELERRAEDDLGACQERLRELCAQVDSAKTPAEG